MLIEHQYPQNLGGSECSVVLTSIRMSISGFSQLLSCADDSWTLSASVVSEIDLLGRGAGGGGGGGGEGHTTGIFTLDRRQTLTVFERVWLTLVDVLGVATAAVVGAVSPEASLNLLRDLYAAEMASGSLPQCRSSTRAF
jgi:hypothetical protein